MRHSIGGCGMFIRTVEKYQQRQGFSRDLELAREILTASREKNRPWHNPVP
jgi:hypothetical protein